MLSHFCSAQSSVAVNQIVCSRDQKASCEFDRFGDILVRIVRGVLNPKLHKVLSTSLLFVMTCVIY